MNRTRTLGAAPPLRLRNSRGPSARALLLASCLLAAPGAVAAQDYSGGQIANYNGTYAGTVRVTTSGGSAYGVTVGQAGVSTNLQGDVAISSGGGSFAHGIFTQNGAGAGAVNLSGTILIATNSVAGSGVRAAAGGVTLTQGPGAPPITINLTSTGGSSNPPDEAGGLYAAGGSITVNGNLVTKEEQIRSYGLWNLSADAAPLTVNGNVQITATNREDFGIRQDRGVTTITGNTVMDMGSGGSSPGVRAASGTLTFGGDLTITTNNAPYLVRTESGFGLWNTSASGASGIVNDVGAAITVAGRTSITTRQGGSIGVYNDSVSGTYVFNGPVDIVTHGGTATIRYYTVQGSSGSASIGAYGVLSGGGTTTFNQPVTINTDGASAGGIRLHGGTVNFASAATLQITTTSSAAHGIYLTTQIGAPRTGTINVGGAATISVSSTSHGVLAEAGQATFAGSSTAITANGSGDGVRVTGAAAGTGGLVVFNSPATIAAMGAGDGVRALSASSQQGAVNFSAASTIGSSAGYGVEVAGGQVSFTATPTISSGAKDAVLVSSGTLTTTAGAKIGSVAAGAYALHTSGTGTLTGSGAFAVTGPMLAEGASTFNLNASNNSVITGDATRTGSAVFNIGLLGNSQWTGTATNVSSVTIDPSTWTVTGSSTVSGTLDNAGVVAFAAFPPGGTYKTLTVQNYIGRDGVMGLNTHLGSDGSASDRLVIDTGAATGSGLLRITNTDGLGARTSSDGILVVTTSNGGATQPGLFALAGPTVAGPYEYTLRRSGLDPADPALANSWFLRSTISCAAVARALSSLCPTPPPTPTPTPGPTPTPEPQPTPDIIPASLPNYRPEVSLYTGLPALAALYGRAAIDNLHDRVGEEEQLRALHGDDDGDVNGVWARAFGWWGHHRGGDLGVYSNEGPGFDYSLTGLQAGVDLWRRQDDKGRRDHAGVYLALGRASGTVYHLAGQEAGTDQVDAWSLGGYFTHFWKSGAYVDAVGQLSWYDVTARSVRLPALTGKATGWTLSGEGGYPLHIEGGWIVEPQGQLTYQAFGRTSGSDIGGQVTFDGTDSLIGRLGLRGARTWSRDRDGEPLETTGWLRFNLFHEFTGQPRTTFQAEDGPIDFQANLGAWWAEINPGLTRQISRLTTVYASGGYQWNLERETQAWTGKLGVRFNW